MQPSVDEPQESRKARRAKQLNIMLLVILAHARRLFASIPGKESHTPD
jgi:hypothetical protein